MIVFLFYSIAIINFLVGTVRKKNTLLAILAFVVIFIIMTYNSDGPDINNYIFGYVNSTSGETSFAEIGYNSLMRLGAKFDLGFYAFRSIISLISLFLLHSTIKFYKVNENCILGLYMFFLFFMDTIQMRNFVVEILFIFSTRYLYNDKRFSTLKYLLCIFIAALFHAIAPVYLILLFCKYVHNRKVYSAMFVFSICSFLFFTLFRSSLNGIVIFVTSMAGVKMSYSYTATRYGFIPIICIYFGCLFIMLYNIKRIGVIDKKSELILRSTLNMHIVVALLLPLILINTNFYRIFRNITLLTLIWLCRLQNTLVNNRARNLSIPMLMIIITAIWWIIDVVLYNSIEWIIVPIFDNNLLFEKGNSKILLESFWTILVVGIGLLVIKTMLLLFTNPNKKQLVHRFKIE